MLPWRWWLRSWATPMTASIAGSSRVKISRAPAWSPARKASIIARISSPAAWPTHGDDAAAAVREPAEVGDVVAGVDGVAHLRQPDAAREVADRVLDRDDGVELDRGLVGLERDAGAGAAGDVVEHDRYVGGLDDRAEVVEHAGLAGLVVVGRDQQQPVGADLLGLLGQLDRVGGGVGADAGDDRGAVADGVLDRGQDLAVLGDARGGRLARRAGDDDAVVAVLDEVRRRSGRCPRGRPSRRRGTRWPWR